jgi:hypothetical protein
MVSQAFRLREIPHGRSAAADDGIWVEGQLRGSRRCRRDGAAAYVAVPSLGQTVCSTAGSLFRSRLARLGHRRPGSGSLRNWTQCAQKAENRHA